MGLPSKIQFPDIQITAGSSAPNQAAVNWKYESESKSFRREEWPHNLH